MKHTTTLVDLLDELADAGSHLPPSEVKQASASETVVSIAALLQAEADRPLNAEDFHSVKTGGFEAEAEAYRGYVAARDTLATVPTPANTQSHALKLAAAELRVEGSAIAQRHMAKAASAVQAASALTILQRRLRP